MDKTKFLNAIGLAVRSNKIIYGQRLIEWVQAGKVSLVIIAEDMGPTAKKKVLDKCKFYNVEVIADEVNIEELNKIINKDKKVSAIAIVDNNIKKLIKSYI